MNVVRIARVRISEFEGADLVRGMSVRRGDSWRSGNAVDGADSDVFEIGKSVDDHFEFVEIDAEGEVEDGESSGCRESFENSLSIDLRGTCQSIANV